MITTTDNEGAAGLTRFAVVLAGPDGPELLEQAHALSANVSTAAIRASAARLYVQTPRGKHHQPSSRTSPVLSAELADRFAGLEPLPRTIAVLRWHEEMDVHAIGEILEVSAQAVDDQLHSVSHTLSLAAGCPWTARELRHLLIAQAVPEAGLQGIAPSTPDPLTPDPLTPDPLTPDPSTSEPLTVAPTAVATPEREHIRAVQVKAPPPYPSQRVVRPLIAITGLLGVNYLVWRWLFSVHWSVWWISVPLILAETYSLVDSMLFGLTMWRLKPRPAPGPPPDGATVDIFITTYDEPLDLVMATALAAQQISYPHTLWILDDGNRQELRELAGTHGIEVISRSADWVDMPHHAKAGNLNNALMVTQGEFIVILDADQVPMPELLDQTLGYFRDERMAIVQTPQFFVNVPDADLLGSQAPLFYGPIQQGKDGWNAAFFCGSNALLRREALLQIGIQRYVRELELRITDALRAAKKVVRRAQAGLEPGQQHVHAALAELAEAADRVLADLEAGAVLADATHRFQVAVRDVSRRLVMADVAMTSSDLDELIDVTGDPNETDFELTPEALDRLSRRDWSPLGAIEAVRTLVASVDVDREDEAQPIMPMSTISVTEDMATCMRVHNTGWKSAYHDEVLAVGLAPEDIGTMLTQRLRWAQGTMQVLLRENPLLQKGLSPAQKLMYLATMWSYFSGFAALAYIAAPVIYLLFGVLPVHSLSVSFFARLIPFLIFNQVLFFVIGRGRHTWRGQQYSLAMFPVWIKAVTSAVGNVVFGRSLSFAVTPKRRLKIEKSPWRLVRPQLFAMALLVVAAAIGIVRLVGGEATVLGTVVNLVWVGFDLLLFSIIPRAVRYRGFDPHAVSHVEATNDPAVSPFLTTLLETSR